MTGGDPSAAGPSAGGRVPGVLDEPEFRALAVQFGTPQYVYHRGILESRYRHLAQAFAELRPEFHYSVKANSNGALLTILRDLGAGFDVVSGGEIARCLAIGADPSRMVFAGVGKTEAEMDFALSKGVGLFNVESLPELELLGTRARKLGLTANVALRINPDIDARTHAYISTGRSIDKFGMDRATAWQAAEATRGSGLRLRGCHVHIGSQITTVEPFVAAARFVAEWVVEARGRGFVVDRVNLGGGFGVSYGGPTLDLSAVAAGIARALSGSNVELLFEPGRFLVADAGWLLGRVLYVKRSPQRDFVITDVAMNDLIRPALYGAQHPLRFDPAPTGETHCYDVVGPICETGDFLARGCQGPLPESGDLLVVSSVGAYGFAMASQYNSRPRPIEVLVEGARARVVRERETLEDLLRGERPGPP